MGTHVPCYSKGWGKPAWHRSKPNSHRHATVRVLIRGLEVTACTETCFEALDEAFAVDLVFEDPFRREGLVRRGSTRGSFPTKGASVDPLFELFSVRTAWVHQGFPVLPEFVFMSAASRAVHIALTTESV